MKTFRQEYMCAFIDEKPRERFLHECADAYHQRTEAFDKTLPWPTPGGWGDPFAKSNKYARQVRSELALLCLAKGISPGKLDKAIRGSDPFRMYD